MYTVLNKELGVKGGVLMKHYLSRSDGGFPGRQGIWLQECA